MKLSTLSQWLTHIAAVHPKEMDLGLNRVKKVAATLGLLKVPCPLIIVGGTNGKGSTVAALESIYSAAGYRVGSFTSPYLFKFNEQVKIQGQEASDKLWCQAFQAVEENRGTTTLTPFEYHTLAALYIFKKHALDLWILEVGLGGRLDAVNILDADVAIVTTIGIDHTEWLGMDRESIAYEKAGIFRTQKPAVCGDFEPPTSLCNYANQLGTPLFCLGKAFHYVKHENDWSWRSSKLQLDQLPLNSLAVQNMATVLMAVELLQSRLHVTREEIDQGLISVNLPGRIQIMPGKITQIFDVSHNPAATTFLANRLRELPCSGKTHAVFSMLADKDIVASVTAIKKYIDHWYVGGLAVKRATPIEKLQASFRQADLKNVSYAGSIAAAYQNAQQSAKSGDRIVVFGSFHTVNNAFLIRNARAHMSTL